MPAAATLQLSSCVLIYQLDCPTILQSSKFTFYYSREKTVFLYFTHGRFFRWLNSRKWYSHRFCFNFANFHTTKYLRWNPHPTKEPLNKRPGSPNICQPNYAFFSAAKLQKTVKCKCANHVTGKISTPAWGVAPCPPLLHFTGKLYIRYRFHHSKIFYPAVSWGVTPSTG